MLIDITREFRQKINMVTEVLNDTIDLLDLINIYRILHSKKCRIHILFKCTWNILQCRLHMKLQNKPQQI